MAISSFISETTAPRLPSLAVAAGSCIYIYRNLRPYYKFVLPPEDVNTEEQECWYEGPSTCSPVLAGTMLCMPAGPVSPSMLQHTTIHLGDARCMHLQGKGDGRRHGGG